MQTKLLDSKLSKGSQDQTLIRLYSKSIGDAVNEKLRIRIRSDAYKGQGFAYCEIYSAKKRKWNPLVHIEPGLMETAEGLCYQPEHNLATELDFRNDEIELLRMAELVLV